jgi:hypothetical protein
MLTPTDIHLLVGVLTQASSPENVTVELGSMVFDTAARKVRDVDVIVEQAIEGIKALKGLEVKKHKEPLDVTHVEQLASKLKDMPSLTSRQIVSASGYTSSAIRKAAAHDVELFSLTDWNDKYSFEHARFNNMSSFCTRSLEYVAGPHIHIEVESHGDAFAQADPSLIEVTDARGRPHDSRVTFRNFETT